MKNSGQNVRSFSVDKLNVNIYPNRTEMGEGAAAAAAAKIRELLTVQEQVSVVFAAAASQNEFLDALSSAPDIDWSRVAVFHMDEYIGLPAGHPQLFANYLKTRIFDKVKPGKLFLLDGLVNPPELEIERYTSLLRDNPVDLTLMGIGENGHIAFNDPAFADFNDNAWIKIVEPDLTSRMQQVHDGCFNTLEDVPTKAFSLTIPALLAAKWIYCVVPGPTKKQAVRRTLEGPIATSCPASILRTHNHAALFLDAESAGEI